MGRIQTLCVEVTAKCPLRCVHCSACAARERTEMLDPLLLEQHLNDLDFLEDLYLSGGEPFEHPALREIIYSSRKVARNVVVYSSGVRMSDAGNEPLPRDALRMVREAGVSRIDVSLYATQALEHDAVTATKGSFELVMETLRRLSAEQIPFGIHYVPMPAVNNVIAVARIARNLGAVRLHVLSLVAQGRARSLADMGLSESLCSDLLRLVDEPSSFELVLSSQLRRELGLVEPTPRDALQSAMLDVRGFLYPSEGRRLPALRSSSSLGERSFRELAKEIHIS